MSSNKVFTLSEVQQLTEDKNKCILIIDNRVYDITKFLDEHPGGDEVLKDQHGKDASDAFEDVGHSLDAREQMKSYLIGEIHPNEAKTKKVRTPPGSSTTTGAADENSSWTKWIVPLVIAVAAVVLFKLLAKSSDLPRSPPTM